MVGRTTEGVGGRGGGGGWEGWGHKNVGFPVCVLKVVLAGKGRVSFLPRPYLPLSFPVRVETEGEKLLPVVTCYLPRRTQSSEELTGGGSQLPFPSLYGDEMYLLWGERRPFSREENSFLKKSLPREGLHSWKSRNPPENAHAGEKKGRLPLRKIGP